MIFTYEPLRILIVKRNMQKLEFAAAAGISPPTLSKLMKDHPVNLDVLEKVCIALDVELHEIIRRKDKE
ncbi:helix-turn-helix domain-containing protein [Paenibacillus hubeiensis]|uniref:helix-turn-helix domain-containing protein n=1 Tax=Paenibacillus hubeiensis TaxID=3077330 RepID=UPI0031B9E41A